jgi:hypothetical protein
MAGYFDSLTLTLRNISEAEPGGEAGIWTGMTGVSPFCEVLSLLFLCMVMLRVCLAGRVGGQANPPGPTCTSSSSASVGKHSAGGDASLMETDIKTRPSNCAETRKARAVGEFGVPRAPSGNMGMSIYRLNLKGVTSNLFAIILIYPLRRVPALLTLFK